MYLPSETIEIEPNDEYRRFDQMRSAYRVKFLPEISPDGSKTICLKFSETSVINPGTYRLIYFSSTSNSVLGVSNSFSAGKYKCTENGSHEVGW